jgi:hypothetical protein
MLHLQHLPLPLSDQEEHYLGTSDDYQECRERLRTIQT